MNNWSPQDWGLFFTAVGTLFASIMATISAYKANQAKQQGEKNTTEIKANTEVTIAGTQAATANAVVAANTAKITAKKTDELKDQLNGTLDNKIRGIVKEEVDPLRAIFAAHHEQDDKNMREIRQALGELRDRTVK